ncbi:hypothetical protein K200098A10_07890 [Flavonifractor plautii]
MVWPPQADTPCARQTAAFSKKWLCHFFDKLRPPPSAGAYGFRYIRNRESTTVISPHTPIASPLMAPSVSPSSRALEVPTA